ncbi:MAG: acetate/propionate family kinase [Propionibacteriaceae bacterium]
MNKSILLLNCGSSSIKYQVIDANTEEVLGSGLVERISQGGDGVITHKVGGEKFEVVTPLPDHGVALEQVVGLFTEHGPSFADVVAVGHRTVHGGQKFFKPTVINDEVIETLRTLIPLAPLHNPAGISGIEAARKILPNVPHVGIFDTAFFNELPEAAYTYAIPAELSEKHSIRRYGFHGTSHSFVSKSVAELIGKPYDSFNQIVCHLGNGASISAIKNGKPVDTTMGLTPLEGLVMGTRSGDVDPGLFKFLAAQEGLTLDEIDTLLNKKSGVFGLSGLTDMRDLEDAVAAKDPKAIMTWDIYINRILKYVGAYMAILGHVDAITFTAGVGENSDVLRKDVCDRLTGFGFIINDEVNSVRAKEPRIVSKPESTVAICVVPTNEELEMARQVCAVI